MVDFLRTPGYQEARRYYAALPVRQGATILVGDSITAGGAWHELLQRGDVLNRGIVGDTVQGVTERLPEILRHQPRTVLLMIGTNDLMRDKKTPQSVMRQYRTLVQAIRRQAPQTRLIMQAIPPVNRTIETLLISGVEKGILEVNQSLRSLAAEQKLAFLDTHRLLVDDQGRLKESYTSGGVHLSITGYLRWSGAVRPLLGAREQ